MDQLFWTNMVVQRPVMETSRDDTPAPRLQQSRSLLDGEKTGAVMLFSGVFLALVGVTFTAMGWHFYQANPNFEWTQLLGPILISIGGTFILTSICKFGIFSCLSCRQWDEDVHERPERAQTSRGHSFIVNGINQPVLLHNTSAMVCFPPEYNFITQEVRQAIQGRSVNAACAPHDAGCCMHNAEDSSARCTNTSCRRNRFQKTEDDDSYCSPPPAYEDIFPSFTIIAQSDTNTS